MLFTGRLTADAEVQIVKGDKKVTKFNVALNKRYKDKQGNKQEKTAYVRCAYWVNAGLADYLKKGAIVEISGWMEAEAWTDREGNIQANLACNVDTIKLFGGTVKSAEQPAAKENGKQKAAVAAGADEDDLPF
jgi:single-strand DNA-binding protein